MALTRPTRIVPATERITLWHVGTTARHRRTAHRWSFHTTVAAIAYAARWICDWSARPVQATRRGHALVAGIYTFVAVDAGLVVVLIWGHR